MPYDQFGYGSYEPPYNLDGSTQTLDPSSRGSYYPTGTGNAWADQQYGPLLSPSEKADAERAYKNVGQADWNISHGSKQALEGFDRMAQERAQKVGVNTPGTPDWIKAKFPGDPKGTVIAPATTRTSMPGYPGDTAFEPNPNYGRPRSGGLLGLAQPVESRYRFKADDAEKVPELRGAPSPTYTPEQAMTPSQNLAEIDRKRGEQIVADRMKAMTAAGPEGMQYPVAKKGRMVNGTMTYDAASQETFPELGIVPNSKMTPAQLTDASAGYQKVLSMPGINPGVKARAERYAAMVDKVMPEAEKNAVAQKNKLDNLIISATNDLKITLGSGVRFPVSAAEGKDAQGKRIPSEFETTANAWKKKWLKMGVPEENLQATIDTLKVPYMQGAAASFAKQKDVAEKAEAEKVAAERRETRSQQTSDIQVENLKRGARGDFNRDFAASSAESYLRSTAKLAPAFVKSQQAIYDSAAEKYTPEMFNPKELFPLYSGAKVESQPEIQPAGGEERPVPTDANIKKYVDQTITEAKSAGKTPLQYLKDLGKSPDIINKVSPYLW